MPARSMISPSRMNIGIATRMKSVLVDQKISPVARYSGSMAYMEPSASASTPMVAATGTDSANSASRRISALLSISAPVFMHVGQDVRRHFRAHFFVDGGEAGDLTHARTVFVQQQRDHAQQQNRKEARRVGDE